MTSFLPFTAYCIIWAWLILLGHPWIGIVAGLIGMAVTMSIIWKIEFNSWKFWE